MSPDTGEVHLTDDGDVWWLELSNPGRHNALTWRMYDRLEEICAATHAAPGLRVLVVRGGGGSFAAGTDIAQFTEFTGADGLAYERRMDEVLRSLLAVRVPVVGVVEGPAVGAGLAIAACCDVLLASEDARFGVPVARTLGNMVATVAMHRLRIRLGAARTTAMFLTARLLRAADAATAGFVHTVCAPEDLEHSVGALVERLRSNAPLTLAAAKEIERRLDGLDTLPAHEDVLARCYGSDDFQEGVAAFLDRRIPEWKGR
ncbi:enoyl-CoA hydratase [Georgenia deserti]|uniref:Enoyl-CoA hydratase n=1 Tax=Georgenia deserti TaxID=2093781 RepID=A0ABW4LBN6_9MICO